MSLRSEAPDGAAGLRVGLAVVSCFAFVSLFRDAPVLFGPEGLAPAGPLLEAVRARFGGSGAWSRLPTVFYVIEPTAGALRAVAGVGALVSLGLAHRRWTAWLALPLALLYLSFASAGTVFYSFQWDNLLVESLVTAVLLSRSPGTAAIWAFRLLLWRLYVESGLAKVLWSGDWTNGVAMGRYWETTPLPTPLAWWADRLPAPVQVAATWGTILGEIGGPVAMFFGRRGRRALCVGTTALQIGILATGNYGMFNYLSLVLGLSLLIEPAAEPSAGLGELTRRVVALLLGSAGLLVAANVYMPGRPMAEVTEPLQRWRLVNAWHLFADIDPDRYEVEVIGSDDGAAWYRLPLAAKPPAPLAWVAPYQPRVAFRLWFATLGGRDSAVGFDTSADPYVVRLATRWCEAPAILTPLLTRPVRSPAYVGLAFERGTFAEDHVGWATELLGRHPVAWRCATLDGAVFPQATELRPLPALGDAPRAE